jgi:large subunit ribosomal protein L31
VNELRVEVCSSCTPFYSGKQRFVDAAARVDKFIKRYARPRARKK